MRKSDFGIAGFFSADFWRTKIRRLIRLSATAEGSTRWPPTWKLLVAVQVTTCRGRGHILAAPLRAALTALDIRLRKCPDLENGVRGPSKSLEMSPFDRARITSYWRSIVYNYRCISVVSEIFNVVKYRDLEIPVKSQSRSLNVVAFDRLDMISY